ncbi:MAG TPA: alcohol dehydrogenase catalytic domain-containing protein [Candidatus Dormibacteraeota bacterium]|nr:alcohol dehydrogenase catalytic domain-containing protein [Candidatus Dormibacteraeota bacterium]
MSQSGSILEASFAMPPAQATMRAAVYRGKGRVVVENVPVPVIAEGEVLIRVAACGICGTDIKKIEYGFVAAPQIFGHEVSGTVVAVGAGVTKWKVGDRVMSFHHVPCGACFYCDRRLFSQCPAYKKVGLTAGFDPNGGGFAQFVRAMPWVAERGMVAIPDGVSFDEASFIEPVNTCIKAVEKARVDAGETALVMGLGPIGLLLMMLSKLRGAKVVGSDPMPERRTKSMSLGADLAVNPRDGHLGEQVRGCTEGRGADVVLVAVPIPTALTEALALARPGGRVLLFAQNDPQMKIEFPAAAVGVEEKEILGSYSAALDRQEEAARLIFTRQLPVRELISHRFSLEDMDRALQLAARPVGDSLKVVIHP